MNKLTAELRDELTGRIIPFWTGLRDDKYGGYAGYVGPDLSVRRDADKGSSRTAASSGSSPRRIFF